MKIKETISLLDIGDYTCTVTIFEALDGYVKMLLNCSMNSQLDDDIECPKIYKCEDWNRFRQQYIFDTWLHAAHIIYLREFT